MRMRQRRGTMRGVAKKKREQKIAGPAPSPKEKFRADRIAVAHRIHDVYEAFPIRSHELEEALQLLGLTESAILQMAKLPPDDEVYRRLARKVHEARLAFLNRFNASQSELRMEFLRTLRVIHHSILVQRGALHIRTPDGNLPAWHNVVRESLENEPEHLKKMIVLHITGSRRITVACDLPAKVYVEAVDAIYRRDAGKRGKTAEKDLKAINECARAFGLKWQTTKALGEDLSRSRKGTP